MLRLAVVTFSLVAGFALSGCSDVPVDNATDGVIRIVASSNVYGDIAKTVAGPDVEVTSVIDDPAQDPHQFEANARVQLALSRADIVVMNGGGYDDFMGTMLAASGNDTARVVDAVALSEHDPAAEGFNEHVWYDYSTMQTVTRAIAAALDIADPADASDYDGRADGMVAELQALAQLETSIAAGFAGAGVIVTEPVPLYLLDACGLENLTPPEFNEAIEQDSDAPAALLQDVLQLISDGLATMVVYNEQTGGTQTEAVIDAARDAGMPVIGVTETLPDGVDYIAWQTGILTAVQEALAS